MSYSTTVTMKGTITIAAPLRKALGIKPGQTISLSLNDANQIILGTGTDMEAFAQKRAHITRNIPDHLKGLSGDALRDASAKAWAGSDD